MAFANIILQSVLNAKNMTPIAIVYNLNVIDLKLSEIVKNIDNVPDSELSDNYLRRYNGYLYSIIDKARQLLKCPAAELGKKNNDNGNT